MDMDMRSKVFNDAVHGSIEIHPLCVKVIDTPQFQRLRFLRQIGFVCFLYPAASHTRFEHCLGVCHLAGQLVRALSRRQPELCVTHKDILCVELAGLCHDLGHGPFSHTWEIFVNKMRPDKHWKHEKASVAMLEFLIESNNLQKHFEFYGLDEKDLIFIKELILKPEKCSDSEWPYKGRPREKGFLYQIVANSENGVDVDKWDYFLRDGRSLGLQVTFEYSRLFNFSRVNNVSKTELPNYKICFRDKVDADVCEMFNTRMMLHRKAYKHRVVLTTEAMFIDALTLANEYITYEGKNGTKLQLCDVVDDLEAMTHLNDDVFQQIFRSSSNDQNMIGAKQIINNILTRRHYPLIGHTQPTAGCSEPHVLRKKLVEHIPPNSSLSEDDICVQLVSINYGNEENPLLSVGYYTKDEPHVCREHSQENIATVLPLRRKENMFKVFCRRYEEDLVSIAKAAFAKACNELHVR